MWFFDFFKTKDLDLPTIVQLFTKENKEGEFILADYFLADRGETFKKWLKSNRISWNCTQLEFGGSFCKRCGVRTDYRLRVKCNGKIYLIICRQMNDKLPKLVRIEEEK